MSRGVEEAGKAPTDVRMAAAQTLFRFIAGDDRAVDRADRGADDPVWLDARLVQRLVDADLVGAERAAALQHEDDLARDLLAAARSHLKAHGAYSICSGAAL